MEDRPDPRPRFQDAHLTKSAFSQCALGAALLPTDHGAPPQTKRDARAQNPAKRARRHHNGAEPGQRKNQTRDAARDAGGRGGRGAASAARRHREARRNSRREGAESTAGSPGHHHGHLLPIARLAHALHRRQDPGAALLQVVGAGEGRGRPGTARHPRRVGALGDGHAGGQRHPRQQRHHLRLLWLSQAHVPAQVPGSWRPGLGPADQGAPGASRVRPREGGPQPRAGPRRVGAADAHVPGRQHPRVPAIGTERPRRHVPLQPRQGAGAAAGGRHPHRRLRQRHPQPAQDGPVRRARAAVGRRVRHLAQGLAPGRTVRGREPVRGEGAAREGGAPVAGPLLPAARRARRRRGRRQGGADPPLLDQRHALLRVLQVHHQQLTRSCSAVGGTR